MRASPQSRRSATLPRRTAIIRWSEGAVIALFRKKTETARKGSLDPTGEAVGVVGRDYRNPQTPSTAGSTLIGPGRHGPTRSRLAQSRSTQVVELPFDYETGWRVIVVQGLVHPHDFVQTGRVF